MLLPAGTIAHVNHANRKVHADRTKDQIKDSPEYDESTFRTPDYRSRVGTYYEDSYRAWPPMWPRHRFRRPAERRRHLEKMQP